MAVVASKERKMKKRTLIVAFSVLMLGLGSAHAAGAKVFLDSVDKSMKISGQMAAGKVPFNPARAVKEMVSILNAVKEFEASGTAGAPGHVVACAGKLKVASAKGASAAKAGQGAFKAAYGDLVNSYKECQGK